jgi:hypothetical protein
MPKNSAQDLIDNLFQTLEDLNDDEKMKNPQARERTLEIAEKKALLAKEITNAAKLQHVFVKQFGGYASFLTGNNQPVQPVRKIKGGDE